MSTVSTQLLFGRLVHFVFVLVILLQSNVVVVEASNFELSNVALIFIRCRSPFMHCVKSDGCKEMINCLNACKGVQKCSMVCILKHSKDNQDSQAFLACLKEKRLIRPHRDAPQCHRPHTYPSKLKTDAIQGTWWVINSMNEHFETWKCQSIEITPTGINNSRLQFKYDMLLEDQLLHSVTGSLRQMRSSGYFQASYKVADVFESLDHWYILYVDKDFMLLYRCSSSSSTSEFQGAFLMARYPLTEPNSSVRRIIDGSLVTAGVGFPNAADIEWHQPDNAGDCDARVVSQNLLRSQRDLNRIEIFSHPITLSKQDLEEEDHGIWPRSFPIDTNSLESDQEEEEDEEIWHDAVETLDEE